MVGFNDIDQKPKLNVDFEEFNQTKSEFFNDHHSNQLALQNDNESVRALTLKDGINYEDDKFDINHVQYAFGYSAADDLNGDGIIDGIEHTIAVNTKIGEVKEQIG